MLFWQIFRVFLNDIIVIGQSIEKHLQKLKTVLKKLHEANLKVKPENAISSVWKLVLKPYDLQRWYRDRPWQSRRNLILPMSLSVATVWSIVDFDSYYSILTSIAHS